MHKKSHIVCTQCTCRRIDIYPYSLERTQIKAVLCSYGCNIFIRNLCSFLDKNTAYYPYVIVSESYPGKKPSEITESKNCNKYQQIKPAACNPGIERIKIKRKGTHTTKNRKNKKPYTVFGMLEYFQRMFMNHTSFLL